MKYGGYALVTDPGGRVVEEYDTVRCGHCQRHYRVQPGSGKTRGWCTLCMQPTCGRPRCALCVPFERALASQGGG